MICAHQVLTEREPKLLIRSSNSPWFSDVSTRTWWALTPRSSQVCFESGTLSPGTWTERHFRKSLLGLILTSHKYSHLYCPPYLWVLAVSDSSELTWSWWSAARRWAWSLWRACLGSGRGWGRGRSLQSPGAPAPRIWCLWAARSRCCYCTTGSCPRHSRKMHRRCWNCRSVHFCWTETCYCWLSLLL